MTEEIYRDSERFEAAGGDWNEDAIQWVGYWGDEHVVDGKIEPRVPWADFTLLAYSQEVGDARPATEHDLELLGYVKVKEQKLPDDKSNPIPGIEPDQRGFAPVFDQMTQEIIEVHLGPPPTVEENSEQPELTLDEFMLRLDVALHGKPVIMTSMLGTGTKQTVLLEAIQNLIPPLVCVRMTTRIDEVTEGHTKELQEHLSEVMRSRYRLMVHHNDLELEVDLGDDEEDPFFPPNESGEE